MTAERDLRVVRLAESIGDRAPVSWTEARLQAGELTRVVEGLERVQAVADAFAASCFCGDRGPAQQTAELWGSLEILESLGRGAAGEVFRARDPNLDREVALKLRRAGPGSASSEGRRMLDEARRLARVRHPNVVTVHGADLCDGRVGIWTELVEGRTLEEVLATDGPLGLGETVSIGLDLCRALAAIHAAGLVHGDIKASNVIRERGGRIVLTDLGSATEVGTAQLTGSPATVAPEVLAGAPATTASDLYSLGLLLNRLLTGLAATEPATSTLREARADLPTAFVQAVERATDPDPDRRPASVGAFERALAHAVDHAVPSGPAAGDTRPSRPGRVARAVVAAAAVAAVAIGLWQAVHGRRPAPPETAASTSAGPSVNRIAPAEAVAVREAAIGEPSVMQPAAPGALEVEAELLRITDDGAETVADGARIRPGDRLSLELEAAEPVHVWVVNEDLHGEVFVLFPIDGLDLGNPLDGDRRHRLPGRLDGVPQHWQVTSAGGRERFLVVASRHPQPELERALAGLAAAGPRSAGVTRGVGGLSPAPATAGASLDDLAERLGGDDLDDAVWLRWVELENP